MSVKLMAAAWTLDMGSTEKLVLLALADWANDDGHCWPGIAKLATKSSLTERGVQKAIQRLCAAGHLTRHEVTGRGVNYYVHPGTSFTPERGSPPNKKTQTPERGSPNTSGTTIEDKANALSKARKIKPIVCALPSWIPADAWAGYEEMRRKMRKGMTIRARELAIKKLEALAAEGHDPGAVLDQSTMNNWQGIFPLKEQGNGNGHMGRNGSPATQRNGQPLRGSRTMELIRRVERELGTQGGTFAGDDGMAGALALPGFP